MMPCGVMNTGELPKFLRLTSYVLAKHFRRQHHLTLDSHYAGARFRKWDYDLYIV